MSVTKTQTGIVEPAKDTRPLYIVCQKNFNVWLDSLTEAQQNWVRETAMPAKAGTCITLPNIDGHIGGAALLTDKNLIWESAGAASRLPSGSWAPELTFSKAASLGDIQLGWGLAQYHFAPHRPDKDPDNKAQLALAKRDQDRGVEAQVRGYTYRP